MYIGIFCIYIYKTMFGYISIYIYIYATCYQLQSEFPCEKNPHKEAPEHVQRNYIGNSYIYICMFIVFCTYIYM